ncbi:MAG: hypothetical protein R3B81_07270 [bacterium]
MRGWFVAAILLAATPVLALYDPMPVAEIAPMEGSWRGTLVYKDYGNGQLVELPTQLFAALVSPETIALHYVFDDGPGKTVHSYERIRFDLAADAVEWVSETEDGPRGVVLSSERDGDRWRLVFQTGAGEETERYTLEVEPAALRIRKEEVGSEATPTFRNELKFERVG